MKRIGRNTLALCATLTVSWQLQFAARIPRHLFLCYARRTDCAKKLESDCMVSLRHHTVSRLLISLSFAASVAGLCAHEAQAWFWRSKPAARPTAPHSARPSPLDLPHSAAPFVSPLPEAPFDLFKKYNNDFGLRPPVDELRLHPSSPAASHPFFERPVSRNEHVVEPDLPHPKGLSQPTTEASTDDPTSIFDASWPSAEKLFAALVFAFFPGIPILGLTSKYIAQVRNRRRFDAANISLATDLRCFISSHSSKSSDLYLFLRPLLLGGSIRVRSSRSFARVSLEEFIHDALYRNKGRRVICVGSGEEVIGVPRVVFDNDTWMDEIVPIFKCATGIVSMPGCTSACLNESALIRNSPELLGRTIFVLPPFQAYNPLPQKARLPMQIDDYFARVIDEHAKLGLYFPAPTYDDGWLVVMDYGTGRPKRITPWKRLYIETRHISNIGARIASSEPTLDRDYFRSMFAEIQRDTPISRHATTVNSADRGEARSVEFDRA